MTRAAPMLWLALCASACSEDDSMVDPSGSGGNAFDPVTTPADPCAPTASLPGVCPSRGLFDAPQMVELSPPVGATTARLHFTLDGSEPTEASPSYDGPLEVAGAAERAVVTLRVGAFADGLSGGVASHSYVFPEFVVDQPALPAGFPDRWGNSDTREGDYAMDPDVVSADRAAAVAGLRALPTLSVVASPDALFGVDDGIYMNPSLEGVEWERTASAELLSAPDAGPGFQINAGLRIQGGSSTEGWKAAKLSMRLLFKAAHGPTKLRYPLFADSPVSEFDTLVLDAHLNLSYQHPDHSQRVRSQYVRDTFATDLCNAAGATAPHAIFVHLYLNGLYWGLYELHERPDDSFASDHLGGPKSAYDVVKHRADNVVEGTAEPFQQLLDLVRAGIDGPEQYAALQQLLHVDSFIDYMLMNFYMGNTDWPRHNWYAARDRTATGVSAGFHFFSWDAEHVLKGVRDDVFDANEGPGEIYQRLIEYPEFRERFLGRAEQHLGPGGVLYVDPADPSSGRPAALYQRRIDEVRPAVVLESARWGDNRREQPYGATEFDEELDWLMREYFPQRSAIFGGQLPSP